MRLNKISLAAFVLGGSVLLAACGGGNDSPLRPVSVVTTSTTASMDAKTGPTVMTGILGTTPPSFDFASGVAKFGTTGQATTLALSGTGAAPNFAVSTTDGNHAEGHMTFGSCHFVIDTSTYPALHPLAQGSVTVVIDPCTISVQTAGQIANSIVTSLPVSLVLEGTTSTSVNMPVAITSTGAVAVNGTTVGTTTVAATTGAN